MRVRPENLDAGLLMWNMRRRIALERLPSRRVVVEFRFTGPPAGLRGPKHFWLLLERRQADLCVEDPGYEVDLYVEAHLPSMARVWLGDMTFQDAVRAGSVRLSGARELTRAFPAWLRLSQFAAVSRRQDELRSGNW